jgi:hypothetical protein
MCVVKAGCHISVTEPTGKWVGESTVVVLICTVAWKNILSFWMKSEVFADVKVYIVLFLILKTCNVLRGYQ